jgi:hypothetical protein
MAKEHVRKLLYVEQFMWMKFLIQDISHKISSLHSQTLEMERTMKRAAKAMQKMNS